MRKGYYLAVSWIDFLAGQIIAELETLGHKDDTVIALVGDHGWQLGEHNIWGTTTSTSLPPFFFFARFHQHWHRGAASRGLHHAIDTAC